MTASDPTQEPGNTIGEVKQAELDIDDAPEPTARAVLFVPTGFDRTKPVDFQVVEVSDATMEDLARRRT